MFKEINQLIENIDKETDHVEKVKCCKEALEKVGQLKEKFNKMYSQETELVEKQEKRKKVSEEDIDELIDDMESEEDLDKLFEMYSKGKSMINDLSKSLKTESNTINQCVEKNKKIQLVDISAKFKEIIGEQEDEK